MTVASGCARQRLDLGAYVFGALTPAERSDVDAHLTGCRDCRDELAGLAGLPPMLSRLTLTEMERLAAGDPAEPPGLLPAVLDLTAARRRRGRRLTALLSAAALILVAVAASLLARTPAPAGQAAGQTGGQSYGAPAGAWRSAAGAADGASVTVMYRPMGWGTQLQAKIAGLPPGTHCQVAVVTAAGTQVTAGGWTTDANAGRVWYPGSAGVPAGTVRAFIVTIAAGGQVTVPA